MDIYKYRDNQDLSDITVIVEGHEYYLHKFPLSISCEYFKNECKNESKIVLKNFPGGKENFETVIDHCYGKEIDFNPEKIGNILKGSEYFGMNGKNNLTDKCQRYIDRMLRTAEYTRSIDPLVTFLNSFENTDDSKLLQLRDKCMALISQLWLRPMTTYKSNVNEQYFEDNGIFELLVNLNFNLLKQIVEFCSNDPTKHPFIGRLVVVYIDRQLLDDFDDEEGKAKQRRTRTKSNSTSSRNSELNIEISDGTDSDYEREKQQKNKHSRKDNQNKGQIFDALILSLPDSINLGHIVTVKWLNDAVSFCEKEKCQTKQKLLRLCSGILTNASMEEIKSMDNKNVTEIIEQTINNEMVDKELMKWIWDHHILEMAKSDELDPALFNKVVKNMPESQKIDPDVIFKIVLSILTNVGNSAEAYRNELIDLVDLERISSNNLEVALESGFWKLENICRIAIKRLKDGNKNNVLEDKESHKHSKWTYSEEQTKPSMYFRSASPTMMKSMSRSYGNYMNSLDEDDIDDDVYSRPIEQYHRYYPSSKCYKSTYSPESYLTLEENLKYELKKISESYSNYYKDRLRPRNHKRYALYNS